jgi:serine/threonine-protein phosphatase 6 regulatory ankyrin repeat subunit B
MSKRPREEEEDIDHFPTILKDGLLHYKFLDSKSSFFSVNSSKENRNDGSLITVLQMNEENRKRTMLMYYCRIGNKERVNFLLDNGGFWSINKQDNHGRTALMFAINNYISNNNNKNIIFNIVEKGLQFQKKYKINLELIDEEGKTALLYAVKKKQHSIVKLLLENGANINFAETKRKTSSIMYASLNYDTEMLKILLNKKYKAEINATDLKGNNALFFVLEKDIKHGCITSGFYQNQREHSIKILIKNGIDINKRNIYGQTPLMRASELFDFSVLKVLIKNGADVNLQDNNGDTALFYVVNKYFDSQQFLDYFYRYKNRFRYLLRKQANINIQNNDGTTLLMLAVQKKDVGLVHYLLQKGANTNLVDNQGNTADMYGAETYYQALSYPPDPPSEEEDDDEEEEDEEEEDDDEKEDEEM